MDWPRMLRGFTEAGILPQQILEMPLAQFWLVWRISTASSRPHDWAEIKRRWNLKYRISKGLAPV